MAFFDRSWYNRAGVEHVMGFCTDEEYAESALVPEFERMLVRSGINLVSTVLVSDAEPMTCSTPARVVPAPIKEGHLAGRRQVGGITWKYTGSARARVGRAERQHGRDAG